MGIVVSMKKVVVMYREKWLLVMRAIDQSFIAGIFQIVILAIMGGIGIMPNCKGQFVTSVESVFPDAA